VQFQQFVICLTEEFGEQRRPSSRLATKTLHPPGTQKAAPKDGFRSLNYQGLLAEPTGFEPATSDVTGRRSNQLNYDSALTQNRLKKPGRSCSALTGGL
jgi:hypothetical protein